MLYFEKPHVGTKYSKFKTETSLVVPDKVLSDNTVNKVYLSAVFKCNLRVSVPNFFFLKKIILL